MTLSNLDNFFEPHSGQTGMVFWLATRSSTCFEHFLHSYSYRGMPYLGLANFNLVGRFLKYT